MAHILAKAERDMVNRGGALADSLPWRGGQKPAPAASRSQSMVMEDQPAAKQARIAEEQVNLEHAMNFNETLAFSRMPRPGIAGATWAMGQGATNFRKAEVLQIQTPNTPLSFNMDTPTDNRDRMLTRESAKLETVQASVIYTRPSGISGSVTRRYTVDRPPSAIARYERLLEQKHQSQRPGTKHARDGAISCDPNMLREADVDYSDLGSGSPLSLEGSEIEREIKGVKWTGVEGGSRDLSFSVSGHSKPRSPPPITANNLEDFVDRPSPSSVSPARSEKLQELAERLASDKEDFMYRTATLPKQSPTNAERMPLTESPRTHKENLIQSFARAVCRKFEQAMEAFSLCDNPRVSCAEAQEVFEKLGRPTKEDEFYTLKSAVDHDYSDDKIAYQDMLIKLVGFFKPAMPEEKRWKLTSSAIVKRFLVTKHDGNIEGILDSKELIAVFRTFDIDGDGWITKEELHSGLSKMGIVNLNDPKYKLLQKLITDADINGDGRINYKEFLDIAGMHGADRSSFDYRSTLGGAAQGFRELNPFDQRLLKKQKQLNTGERDYEEPDTPMGLVRWRRRYTKGLFGDKYFSETEKASVQFVKDRAEGRIPEEKPPLSAAKERYFAQMKIAVKPATEDEYGNPVKPGTTNALDMGVNDPWSTSAHTASRQSFSSRSYGPAPALPRVDQRGISQGIRVPGDLNPNVDRERGAFRRACLLPATWNEHKDAAIRSSLNIANTVVARHMREPTYVTTQRVKTLKTVAKEADKRFDVDIAPETLTGRINVTSPYTRFGGQWSFHDTVGDILVQGSEPLGLAKESTRPLVQELPQKLLVEGEEAEDDPAGLPSAYSDVHEFHRPPLQKDLFGTTILKGFRRSGNAPRSVSKEMLERQKLLIKKQLALKNFSKPTPQSQARSRPDPVAGEKGAKKMATSKDPTS